MPLLEKLSSEVYKQRREALINAIEKTYPEKSGIILLFGDYEQECYRFKQERNFYYLTGIIEPAAVLVIDLATHQSTLYVPNFGNERSKWMANAIIPERSNPGDYGVDTISWLGERCAGYQCYPFFEKGEYGNLLSALQKAIEHNRSVFTLFPNNACDYMQQRFILQRMESLLPHLGEHLVDISGIIEHQRRKKTNQEIELLYKAISITADAHDAVSRAIKPGIQEYELQALIEYVFTARGASTAFPSIVASGINSTILHYHDNIKPIQQNELVVIDIGAEYSYYCADLTRTYPVGGTFTKRQREIYSLVLEVQEYIASIAKPGYWLSYKNEQDKSLNHLARKFLKERGYEDYFIHGIGHFLGLDVHDVGDYTRPLEVGDVITIEPGIYLPDEQLGVRIEDDYWIVPDGAICLSEDLPKQPDDIETMMQQRSEEESSEIDYEEELETHD